MNGYGIKLKLSVTQLNSLPAFCCIKTLVKLPLSSSSLFGTGITVIVWSGHKWTGTNSEMSVRVKYDNAAPAE